MNKSVLVCSFNAVSGHEGHRRGKRNLVFILNKKKLCGCGCAGYHTLNVIWDVFAWSMRAAMLGVSPSARHNGGAWTENDVEHRFQNNTVLPKSALVQIRGDWERLTVCFRFRTWSNDLFCWMCDACKRGENAYDVFLPDAPHRSTLISHEARAGRGVGGHGRGGGAPRLLMLVKG